MKKFITKAKVILKRINFKSLQQEVQGYGFNYSLNRYLATVVLILSGIVGLSYFFKLNVGYISILTLVVIFTLPIIVVAQVKTMYHFRKFEEMNDYMTHMLISFKIHPKILSALQDTRNICDGALRTKIDEVIDFIKNDSSSPDVYQHALQILEKEYPNSRIHALHRMLITVENENSKDYRGSADDLFNDIETWAERTYVYQQELKMTKTRVVLSIVLAIIICLMLVIGLPTELQTFTTSPVYQALTALFLCASLAVYGFTQTKLNGQWLFYDIDDNKKEAIVKNVDFLKHYDFKKAKKQSFMLSFALLPIVLYGVYIQNTNLIVIGILAMVCVYFQKHMSYTAKKKAVENELKMEFPLWLRDISLNLHNFVVTRAIKNSYETSPVILKHYLKEFIDEIEKNPNSIVPYQDFLSEFNIPDLTNSMRSLYSIKLLGDTDSQRQITNLITRNQKMLANSEKIRNENSLSGIGFISLVPILFASINLIMNMVLLFSQFMSNIPV